MAVMKVNELFGMLNSGLDEAARKNVQNLVRRIVTKRRELALANDIACVYQARHRVASHLGVPVCDLDTLWALQPVSDYLNGFDLIEDNESEVEDQDEDEDDVDYVPTDEESDNEVHCMNRALFESSIKEIHVNIFSLRSKMFWIGSVVMLLHGMATLVTVMTVTSCPANTLPGRQIVLTLWRKYWQ